MQYTTSHGKSKGFNNKNNLKQQTWNKVTNQINHLGETKISQSKTNNNPTKIGRTHEHMLLTVWFNIQQFLFRPLGGVVSLKTNVMNEPDS